MGCVESSTSITSDNIRCEGFLAWPVAGRAIFGQSYWAFRYGRQSQNPRRPRRLRCAIKMYSGRSRLHLRPCPHTGGERGRADLVVEISSLDNSAYITHSPKDTVLYEWGQLTCAWCIFDGHFRSRFKWGPECYRWESKQATDINILCFNSMTEITFQAAFFF